jgi:hypothetical protein
MRHQDSECVFQTLHTGAVSAGMARRWAIPLVLGALLVMPQVANAYSFAGSDWLVDITGYVTLTGILSGQSQAVNELDAPTTISQTTMTDIIIPISVPPIITIDVPGTVSGTHVTAHAFQPGPYEVTVSGYNLRLYDVTAHLEGDATSINPLDQTGGYGDRVFGITGNASPTSYITIADIKMDLGFGWTSVSSANLRVDSWSADRGIGIVPEPGTLAMLLGLAASLVGYACWKRRGSH